MDVKCCTVQIQAWILHQYAVLSNCRGYSQILFPWILNPHVYLITLKLQHGVGATCLAGLLDVLSGFQHKGLCSPPPSLVIRWNYEQVEYISHIPCVQTLFSQHSMAGFAWDELAVWGGKLSTRPSQRAIHTQHVSVVLQHLLKMITTGDDPTIKSGTTFRRSKSSIQILKGYKPNISFAMLQPILPIIVIGSEGGTVQITAWVHIQLCPAPGTHNVTARLNGGYCPSNSAGAGPEDTTPESTHHHIYEGSYIPQWVLHVE